MSVSGALRQIADLIDELEAAGYTVNGLSPTGDDILLAEGDSVSLSVLVPLVEDIEVPAGIRIEPKTTSIDEHGALAIEFAVTSDGAGDAAGESETAEAAEAMTDADSTTTDMPAHRDPEKLQAVYDSHDTFEAMKEALDTEVTAQTVRRNMIKHGFHDPEDRQSASEQAQSDSPDDPDAAESTADDTPDSTTSPSENSGGDEEPEAVASETPLTDGIDLPTETSLDDIKNAVSTAKTVHDVQRRLDISRERTQRLLRELNLLDLVSGRIVEEQEVTREEIDQRIDRAAPPGA